MGNDQARACASSKAKSGDADDAVMADQRGGYNTSKYGKIVCNRQMRGCVQCVCKNEQYKGNKKVGRCCMLLVGGRFSPALSDIKTPFLVQARPILLILASQCRPH